MSKLSVFILCFLLFISFSYSQIIPQNEAKKWIKNAKLIEFNAQNHSIKRILFEENIPLKVENWDSWLADFNTHFFPNTTLKFWKKEVDLQGFSHLVYRQYYQNEKIEYAILKAHVKEGIVYQLNAELYVTNEAQNISNKTENIDAEKAKEIAKTHFLNQNISDSDMEINLKEALYFPLKENGFTHAYKVDIYAHSPEPKRSFLYISAENGEILFEENKIEFTNVTGTAVTKYCGTQQITTDSINPTTFTLNEMGARNIHTVDMNQSMNYAAAINFTDADNYWNTQTNQDNAAYDAHFGAEKTFDYYYNTYGRNSYDNAGASINSFVHFGQSFSNAFWDGTQMTYGDGNGSSYKAFTSTDIVAHEITHAVTENSAGLIYSYESGALNEGFSDIFGVTVDFYANPTTANFFMGDQVSVTNTPFRNMAQPNMYYQPDTYLGSYWTNSSWDNGGVHTNSGVINYWYYLICNGGSGTNDLGNSYSVSGLGMSKAAAITYRTLNVYLTPNSQYADARTYAIQSAIDLYGACSNEVEQVTNAWYAVGIGSLYLDAVQSNFTADNTYFCAAPAIVHFSNSSSNMTTCIWDFGDGTTDTTANPSHTYTGVGNFTVSLIAEGTALCSNGYIDTLVLSQYIMVYSNAPVPISASCTPTSDSTGVPYGIKEVKLDIIDNVSFNSSEGYKDFSCEYNPILTTNTQYALEINTFNTQNNLKAWIDYNNDGAFSNNEKIGDFGMGVTHYQSIINIPANGVVLNAPLRMRVLSNANSITSACQNALLGQAEDYQVTIQTGQNAPIADFLMSDSIIWQNGNVHFSDLSSNSPTSWSWTLNGSTTVSSTLQNVNATFPYLGTYNIQLIATNAYGSDTIVKTIKVLNQILMCSGATSQTSTAANGILYDSGGSIGAYYNNENCSLLISPGSCTDSIVFSFSFFATELNLDYLKIYDGTSASGTLLLTASGPSIPTPVTATSGSMFIQWHSSNYGMALGFEGNWQAYQHFSPPPTTNFSYTPTNPVLQVPVQFQDLSSADAISWFWDFGDGNISFAQNPTHQYSQPNTYNVMLITKSCSGTPDTLIQSISTQASPTLSYSPASFSVNLSCKDTVTLPFYIQNTGSGTLIWNIQNYITPEVLVWTYGVDMGLTGEYNHTMAAINQYFPNYNYTTTATNTPSVMQDLLLGKTTLLIPEKEIGIPSYVSPFDTVIQRFVENGGTVIFCGDNQTYTWQNVGIFSGVAGGVGSYVPKLPIIDNSTPLTEGLGDSISIVQRILYVNISNPNKRTIVKNGNYEILTYMPYGKGKAIYIGYDYQNYNNDAARIIANAVKWSGSVDLDSNLVASLSGGTTAIGATDTTYFQVFTNQMGAGLDTFYVVLQTNDVQNPQDSIPVFLNISPLPCANFDFLLPSECSPQVNFTDKTTHYPSSWLWKFGDGSTSTLQNVNHTYASTGNYTVTLIVTNADGMDSTSQNISINSVNGLTNTVCFPFTLAGLSNYGIKKVELNTLINNSLGTKEGNQDFTCLGTTLQTGSQYMLNVETFGIYNFVKAWIDYDNDGVFSNTELIANFPSLDSVYQQLISIPTAGVTLNTPLRLRVMSNNVSVSSACQNLALGQAEDYSITIESPMLPPVANFLVSDTVLSNTSVNFTDLSSNGPTSWQWIISGSVIGATNLHNPTTSFPLSGTYNVRLIASNAYGSDTVDKNIVVVTTLNMCGGSIFGNGVTHSISGTLYDSGGPTAKYQDNEMCSMLIATDVCTDSIRLAFLAFDTQSGYDILKVYNGTSTLPAQLLLTASGNTLPNAVTAHSANMLIKWESDGSLTRPGFIANWQAYEHISPAPTANFSFAPNNCPLLDTVYFQDLSSSTTNTWFWLFGDGFASNLQNPKHKYLLPGTYTVTLIATSCGSSDTITQNVAIQPSPNVVYAPDSFNVSLGCAQSVTLPFTIQNTNGGLLNWDIDVYRKPNILVWTYGVNMTSGGIYQNTMTAINQYFTHYTSDTTSTTNPAFMQTLLYEKTTLLIPQKQSGNAATVNAFAPVIQNFVQNGGTVIVCGGGSPISWNNIGIFTGTSGNSLSVLYTLQVADTISPLSDGLGSTIPTASYTYFNSITNLNKKRVIPYVNYDVVASVPYGQGKGIYLGFDFGTYNNDIARIIANAVKWSGLSNATPNLSFIPDTGSAMAGNASTVYVQMNAINMFPGVHNSYLVVNSNDLNHLHDSIPISVNILNTPCVNFGSVLENLCSGTVAFTDSTTNFPAGWLWKFGDGTTSWLQNPTHTYLSVGTYNVTLISYSSSGSDSISKTVIIPTLGATATPICEPQSAGTPTGLGIMKVELATLNYASQDASEGYQDLTCSQITTLNTGTQYLFKVKTYSIGNYVQAWIDFNNDGDLTASEQIADFSVGDSTYEQIIAIPANGVPLHTPLRMRVLSDNTFIASSCQNPWAGQAEDYQIILENSVLAPIANFQANLYTSINANTTFMDLSTNSPSAWEWRINGGAIISTLQNPHINFPALGTYNVQLIASNGYGSDTISKTIQVINAYNMCGNALNGTIGMIYDSGGALGDYQNNEMCSFTFSPGICVDSIRLTFQSLHTASQDDYIAVYDGSTGVMIDGFWGNNAPNPILIPSGSLYVEWISNSANTSAGFEAYWQLYAQPLAPPIANFSSLPNNPTVSANINFQSLCSASTSAWHWDFGDGTTSDLTNPTHIYSAAGTYTVTLIATSCLAYDTITQTITIGYAQGISNSIDLFGNVQVYPNPFQNSFTVELGEQMQHKDFELEITNVLGQVVYQKAYLAHSNEKYVIPTSFGAGIYHLSIKMGENVYRQKLVKE